MLLALLIPVPGRLGGAVGGPLLPLLALLLIAGGAAKPFPPTTAPGCIEGGAPPASDTARCAIGGIRGIDVGPAAGGPLAVRGGPAGALGGGGVALLTSVS